MKRTQYYFTIVLSLCCILLFAGCGSEVKESGKKPKNKTEQTDNSADKNKDNYDNVSADSIQEETQKYNLENSVFPECWPEDFALFDAEGNITEINWVEKTSIEKYYDTGEFGVNNRIACIGSRGDGDMLFGYLWSDASRVSVESISFVSNDTIEITGLSYSYTDDPDVEPTAKEMTMTFKFNFLAPMPTIEYRNQEYIYGGNNFGDPLPYLDGLYLK